MADALEISIAELMGLAEEELEEVEAGVGGVVQPIEVCRRSTARSVKERYYLRVRLPPNIESPSLEQPTYLTLHVSHYLKQDRRQDDTQDGQQKRQRSPPTRVDQNS
jgi:hypothetical protein